jgi:hypothetical protein
LVLRVAVALVAVIEARQGVVIRGEDGAGLDEDADERGDVLRRDEIVEDDGSLIDDAVLEDHESSGLRLTVPGGQVDLIIALGGGDVEAEKKQKAEGAHGRE